MKRSFEKNINSKTYLNAVYKDRHWLDGYADAVKRLQAEVDLIDTPYAKHLDIGCADGQFTKLLMDKFPETDGYGLDISEEVIKQATEDSKGAHFWDGDCYSLPYEDDFFDMVHAAELIEHLEEPAEAIVEMRRVLKSGGHLILTTINKNAAPYEEHLWSWDLEDVLKFFEGFEIIGIKDSFNGSDIFRIVAQKI